MLLDFLPGRARLAARQPCQTAVSNLHPAAMIANHIRTAARTEWARRRWSLEFWAENTLFAVSSTEDIAICLSMGTLGQRH